MSKARGLADLGNVYDDGALSNRNLIINGGMAIDQRNGGASSNYTSGQTFHLDRFSVEAQGLSGLIATVQQVSDAPSGFNHSMKTTITSSPSSGLSSSMIGADQRIEGYNISALGFGGSNAESFTLSFWVKSSVTGTYCVSFFNGSVDRAYLATYTVNSANTWEYKTITVAGDTSGTWNTTNGIGLGMQFSIGGGLNLEGTAGAWGSTYKSRVSGAVILNEMPNNPTWQITGVQLEVGDTATPFEHRSYGQELALCQRYYHKSDAYFIFPAPAVSYAATYRHDYPATMRSIPTLVASFSTFSNAHTWSFAINTEDHFDLSVTASTGGNVISYLTFTADAEL